VETLSLRRLSFQLSCSWGCSGKRHPRTRTRRRGGGELAVASEHAGSASARVSGGRPIAASVDIAQVVLVPDPAASAPRLPTTTRQGAHRPHHDGRVTISLAVYALLQLGRMPSDDEEFDDERVEPGSRLSTLSRRG
jgi:hypothetical protein